jgi:DNA-binding FadR family transcriptional regulator
MTTAKTRPTPPPPTATEAIFESILADIVRGTYPPGARLPAERELSRSLGASRPTLREALRRLTEWRLVEPKRGSGIVVLNRADWSIEVLPAYLRYARPAPGEASIAQLIKDLLTIRRTTIREVVHLVGPRIKPGGTAKAREAVQQAWAGRTDLGTFTVADFNVVRAVVEAGHFLPAVWLLNRLSGIYLDIAQSLTGRIEPPDDYVAVHTRFLDALEEHDGERAAAIIEGYLDQLDKIMMAPLEVFL